MAYLVAGIVVFGFLYLLGRGYVSADPHSLVRGIRYTVGSFFILMGLVLIVARSWPLGIIAIGAGASAIATGRIGPFDLGGGVRRAAGSGSTVRSDWFEMQLDHDSGAMNGRVLRGEFAGRSLDRLDENQLIALARSVGASGDSAALLEAYLDRRIPGWRENIERDGAARARGAANAGPMTDKEAYEVLGLLPGATQAEIRAAHRRLMKAVHPDQGGSTFLAAKINQAKDRLLGTHH